LRCEPEGSRSRTRIGPRALGLALTCLLAFATQARAAPEDEPTGRLETFVQSPTETPYVGEPLRLVLRSAVHGRIANDRIAQPALTDFDWQQFGVDSSSEELIDGFWTPVIERVLMIYPLRAGRLTIPPFKRRISYLTRDGERGEIEFTSQPLTIETRARDGVVDPTEFWLPARSLRIVDRWEPEPDKIPFGETAKRIVTVEAEGVTADRLPPLPSFRAPGVITFAGPVERRTIVTDNGPIGRAVYRWNVRPVSATAAVAPPIHLRWFDVSARTMREAAAPERRIAFIDTTQEPQPTGAGASTILSPRALLAALLGFLSTAAAAYLAVSSKAARSGVWPHVPQTRSKLRALRAAARKADIAAFRRALRELSEADPEGWRRIAARSDIAPALAAIDAAMFAREAPPSPAPLASLARMIAAALHDVEKSRRGQSSR
jgi:hypothetical protein